MYNDNRTFELVQSAMTQGRAPWLLCNFKRFNFFVILVGSGFFLQQRSSANFLIIFDSVAVWTFPFTSFSPFFMVYKFYTVFIIFFGDFVVFLEFSSFLRSFHHFLQRFWYFTFLQQLVQIKTIFDEITCIKDVYTLWILFRFTKKERLKQKKIYSLNLNAT